MLFHFYLSYSCRLRSRYVLFNESTPPREREKEIHPRKRKESAVDISMFPRWSFFSFFFFWEPNFLCFAEFLCDLRHRPHFESQHVTNQFCAHSLARWRRNRNNVEQHYGKRIKRFVFAGAARVFHLSSRMRVMIDLPIMG